MINQTGKGLATSGSVKGTFLPDTNKGYQIAY